MIGLGDHRADLPPHRDCKVMDVISVFNARGLLARWPSLDDLERIQRVVDEQPVQVFGCWLKGWEEGPMRLWGRPNYVALARCAAGCHTARMTILGEELDPSRGDILEYVVRDLVVRVSLAHAGLED